MWASQHLLLAYISLGNLLLAQHNTKIKKQHRQEKVYRCWSLRK